RAIRRRPRQRSRSWPKGSSQPCPRTRNSFEASTSVAVSQIYCLEPYLAVFSPDGQTLAASGTGSPIQLWDVKTGKLRRSFGGDAGPRRLAYSPDGKTIAWSGEGSLRLWDVATAKELWQVPMSVGGFHSLAFSPDGKVLASGGEDGVIRL